MEGRFERQPKAEAELGFSPSIPEGVNADILTGEHVVGDGFVPFDRMPTVEELREVQAKEESPLEAYERLRRENPLGLPSWSKDIIRK